MSKGLKNQKKQKYHHQNEYSNEACERELKTRRKLEAQNDIAIHLKKTWIELEMKSRKTAVGKNRLELWRHVL